MAATAMCMAFIHPIEKVFWQKRRGCAILRGGFSGVRLEGKADSTMLHHAGDLDRARDAFGNGPGGLESWHEGLAGVVLLVG